ncbi:MAG: hypothetical protein NVSMB52_19490 [Chloroflexota bacterium]
MMTILRKVVAIFLFVLFVTGCSKHSVGATPAASVAGKSISWSEVQAYVDYAVNFYRRDSKTKTIRMSPCTAKSTTPVCIRLHRQVLRRLLEERVILVFAHKHGIVLSTPELRRISRELRSLTAEAHFADKSLKQHQLAFLHRVLVNEALVQKVEDQAVGQESRAGQAFHLLTISIPIDPVVGKLKAYREAVDLATDGQPIPPEAGMRVDWKAAFRLPVRMYTALVAAKSGQYIGPFLQGDRYVDIQYLGKGIHRLGGPARAVLKTKNFRQWLYAQLVSGRPGCFRVNGTAIGCPVTDH